MFFLTLRPSDPISPWEKRTGSQTLPASPTTLPSHFGPFPRHLPLTLHLHPKPFPLHQTVNQTLKEETMPLEIPPQVHNYMVIGLLSFPIIANLSSVHQKGAWSLPSASQPFRLFFLTFSPFGPGTPWGKKKTPKIPVLVPGQSAGAGGNQQGSGMGNGQV